MRGDGPETRAEHSRRPSQSLRQPKIKMDIVVVADSQSIQEQRASSSVVTTTVSDDNTSRNQRYFATQTA